MKSVTPTPNPVTNDALEARYALRVAARLTEGTESIGPDIAERLRFAREQALQRAAAARRAVAESPAVVASIDRSGTATLGAPTNWWLRLASVVPLFALVAGLLLIEKLHDSSQISAAAEIDAALLADDLPPRAYSDEGFLEFLKTPKD